MRFFLIVAFCLSAASCSKNSSTEAQYSPQTFPKYDTTVIDSFAPGATPNNMKPKVLLVEDTLHTKKKEIEEKIKALEKQKEADKEKEKKKQESKAKDLPNLTSPPAPSAEQPTIT